MSFISNAYRLAGMLAQTVLFQCSVKSAHQENRKNTRTSGQTPFVKTLLLCTPRLAEGSDDLREARCLQLQKAHGFFTPSPDVIDSDALAHGIFYTSRTLVIGGKDK